MIEKKDIKRALSDYYAARTKRKYIVGYYGGIILLGFGFLLIVTWLILTLLGADIFYFGVFGVILIFLGLFLIPLGLFNKYLLTDQD